jgi:hypothetical protein
MNRDSTNPARFPAKPEPHTTEAQKDTLPPKYSAFSGLWETIEVLMDRNMVQMIEQSRVEIPRGKVRPLTDLLEDRQ